MVHGGGVVVDRRVGETGSVLCRRSKRMKNKKNKINKYSKRKRKVIKRKKNL